MRSTLVVALAAALLTGLGCGNGTGPRIRLDVSPSPVFLLRNDSVRLSVSALNADGQLVTGVAVSFVSSDTTIVTVTNLGVVHSSSTVGEAVVEVSGAGGFTDVPVTVTGTPSNLVITPADTAIRAAATVQYRATVLDETGDTIRGAVVTWQSADASIATITPSGLATAQSKAGVTVIRASFLSVSRGATLTVLDSMVAARTQLPGRPHAAAISGNIAYVTQLDLARASRANLPSQAFTANVTVGSTPTGIAFNSSGSRVYVTNQYSNSISIVNVASNSLIDEIAVGNRPFEVIVAPGDSILYVAKIDSVYGIRLATKAIIAQFPIPDAGNGIAIARDTLLYVSTHGGGTVVEFNLKTRARGRTFAVGGTPQKMVVSPNGNELYIANEAGYVQFWNIDTGVQIGSNLALPSAGYGIARRPSNGLLYVTSAYFGGGYLYVVDPASRTLIHSTIVGGSTRHVVFNANGSIGIVANEGGWVDFLK